MVVGYAYFRELVEFCKDVKAWLDADSVNIVAMHCKGGKGTCRALDSKFHRIIICWILLLLYISVATRVLIG